MRSLGTSSTLQLEVYSFPEALDENVTKFRIAHTVFTQDSAIDLACLEGLECLKIDGLKPQKIVSSPPLATV